MSTVIQAEPVANSKLRDQDLDSLASPTAMMHEPPIKDLVQLFKLLADETRLRVLFFLLHDREMHVRAFCDRLGQSQPAVSHHLALLRNAGLIAPRREGKHNFYRLVPQRFHDLLHLLFASVPLQERRYRFEDYVLSYAPVTDEPAANK